ncbi:hypothetical protein TW95_gp1592 [Pandoravirus inopinatum]|uniref:Uncharacterized protein n=1 Tax=Pandoravirus inopinatum TaxID=1605721 RepID=A0A0B5JBD9_9VIRU|nr:hypothetical protein TW95_gp1592 [Pandoravirus inopinatum]AJF98326.1 hypothetical protein [Pandoravirus inopinatum]
MANLLGARHCPHLVGFCRRVLGAQVDRLWACRHRLESTTATQRYHWKKKRFGCDPTLLGRAAARSHIFSLFFFSSVPCVCGGKGRRSAGGRLTRRLSPKGSTNRGKEGTERAPPLHVEREKNRATTD